MAEQDLSFSTLKRFLIEIPAAGAFLGSPFWRMAAIDVGFPAIITQSVTVKCQYLQHTDEQKVRRYLYGRSTILLYYYSIRTLSTVSYCTTHGVRTYRTVIFYGITLVHC